MTQRTLNTAIGGRAVTVLMGWDKPVQYHVMVVETFDGDDEPRYSNLDDDEAGLAGRLAYFAKKARTFGIELPPAMLAKLQADEVLNLGDATSSFDATGIETQE
ncbi:hypothetical protein ABH944_008531 [Caballeronia udeis]|uniref:Uncharacterized protein n=1 Tax=Caballeronia udeis TaxID=1232866 RepID=A0ABW8N0G6_9BURK